MTDRSFRTDDRGVSTTISYVLNLTLAAILISALLFAAGTVVENQRQSAIREELDVIGNRLAISLQQANRTAALANDTSLRMEVVAPESVAGTSYTITIDPSGSEPEIVLTSADPEVNVEVSLAMPATNLEAGTVDGGTVVVILQNDGDLEVTRQ